MMALDDDTLREIADSVCWPLLGVGTTPGTNPGTPDPPPLLAASIEIEGAWEGTVQLACPAALLDRMASAMFGRPVEQTDEREREETLLELANMFGGTVKGMVPGPSLLGLPRGAAPDITDAVALAVGDESMFVSVHGFEADAAD